MMHQLILFISFIYLIGIQNIFTMEHSGLDRQTEDNNQPNWFSRSDDWREKEAKERVFQQRNGTFLNINEPCLGDVENMDKYLIQQLILNAPQKLQRIVKNLKAKKEKKPVMWNVPNKIILVGKPGTGKSSLAQAIALYCNIECTFIKIPAMFNEYINSGSGPINRICAHLRNVENLHIVIFDELQCLVKKRQNKELENDAAEAFWVCLDEFKKNPNIIVIGTANEIKNLPKQVLSRLSKAIFTLTNPTPEIREKIVRYYISLIPGNICVNLDENDIKQIISKTENCVPRDLENIILDACDQVDCESGTLESNDYSSLNLQDVLNAIKTIKENNGDVSCYKYIVDEYIKPNTGTILQIAVPLGVNLVFNYCCQQIALQQSERHHDELMAMNQAHHESMLESNKIHHKMLMEQNDEFHNKQLIEGAYHSFDLLKSNALMPLATKCYIASGILGTSGNPLCLVPLSGGIALTVASLTPSKFVIESIKTGGRFFFSKLKSSLNEESLQ